MSVAFPSKAAARNAALKIPHAPGSAGNAACASPTRHPQRLAEIYGWFTEGFDTPDLKEARRLLEEMS